MSKEATRKMIEDALKLREQDAKDGIENMPYINEAREFVKNVVLPRLQEAIRHNGNETTIKFEELPVSVDAGEKFGQYATAVAQASHEYSLEFGAIFKSGWNFSVDKKSLED